MDPHLSKLLLNRQLLQQLLMLYDLQIRNATISFESTDGSRFTTNGGIGPVPALKIRGRAQLNKCFYAELEADGIYAPVSYLNGSDNEIVGAILDASIRMGGQINESGRLFLNIRYLGGGATGTVLVMYGPVMAM